MITSKYMLETVSNALQVLDYVGQNGYSTLTQISESLQINKTVVFRMLHTLQHYGYIDKTDNGAYTLGFRLISQGQTAIKQNAIHQLAKGTLKKLTEQYNETSHMGILNDDQDVLIVSKVDASSTIQMTSNIGRSLPAYCSAMGKCLLACLEAEERSAYLARGAFERRTANTLVSAATLNRELASVMRSGFALDNEESEEGLYCIAVPVLDRFGKAFAAISLSGPATRMKHKAQSMVDSLKAAALQVSAKALGEENPGE